MLTTLFVGITRLRGNGPRGSATIRNYKAEFISGRPPNSMATAGP
jgi:hypothetical protein